MAQKVIVVLNAPAGEELNVDGIKYALEQEGYDVELVEDTLQQTTYQFQPLAYAIQDDAVIALENNDCVATEKLVDVLSRRASGSDNLAEAISETLYAEIEEGFEDEDLEDEDDEEEE